VSSGRSRRPAAFVTRVGLICTIALTIGCAHSEARSLKRASRSLGKSVARADAVAVRAAVAPGARGLVDLEEMTSGTARRAWSKALSKPTEVVPEAVVFVATDQPVRVVWTQEGWRFGEDPTDLYAQATPRQALRSLVLASRNQRWDVLVRLAPRRYRIGLSAEDLELAWTQGDYGQALTAARDRLAQHLADPIIADAHEAVLDMGDGRIARLEREHDRWVVVDF
jgi:hypothetical protein